MNAHTRHSGSGREPASASTMAWLIADVTAARRSSLYWPSGRWQTKRLGGVCAGWPPIYISRASTSSTGPSRLRQAPATAPRQRRAGGGDGDLEDLVLAVPDRSETFDVASVTRQDSSRTLVAYYRGLGEGEHLWRRPTSWPCEPHLTADAPPAARVARPDAGHRRQATQVGLQCPRSHRERSSGKSTVHSASPTLTPVAPWPNGGG